MFDGVLKSKFYNKCKSNIKLTKARLEVIKKKRNSVEKYLTNDIVDLLRNGLDMNAYGRAEGLLVEQNLTFCYQFIYMFCGCIYNHVSAMQKQRECPEECKEAIPSLIYATARFADLPELRDLRTVFTERYGNSLEPYISKEFVERLKSTPPTKETKLQLLQDIAQESSIKWDIKALKQKLHTPTLPKQYGSFSNTDDDKCRKTKDDSAPERHNQDIGNRLNNRREHIASKRNDRDLTSHGRKDVTDNKYRMPSSSEDETTMDLSQDWPKNSSKTKDDSAPERHNQDIGNRLNNRREHIATKRNDRDLTSHGRKDVTDNKFRMPSSSEDETTTDLSQDGPKNSSSSNGSVSKDEVDKRPFPYRFVPPPYLKPKAEKIESNSEEPTKLNGDVDKEADQHIAGPVVEDKPKPRSVRSQKLKPPPGRDHVGSSETEGVKKKNSSGTKQEDARRGLRTTYSDDKDSRDEEERKLDDLLMRFSKKQSPYESGKGNANLRPPPKQRDRDNGESTRNRRSGLDFLPPARAASLSPEPTEATKRHVRTTSLQPEMLGMAGHVHPKLPDYDELADRVAALGGDKRRQH